MKETARGMMVYEEECPTNKALERKLTGRFSCSVVIWECSVKQANDCIEEVNGTGSDC